MSQDGYEHRILGRTWCEEQIAQAVHAAASPRPARPSRRAEITSRKEIMMAEQTETKTNTDSDAAIEGHRLALDAIDSVIAHIAAAAAEHDLPDDIALAATMAGTARLAIQFLGAEAAAREFRETAAQIEAHAELVARLEEEEPAGTA